MVVYWMFTPKDGSFTMADMVVFGSKTDFLDKCGVFAIFVDGVVNYTNHRRPTKSTIFGMSSHNFETIIKGGLLKQFDV